MKSRSKWKSTAPVQQVSTTDMSGSLADISEEKAARIILQSQEIERNALGRELHDNINQILASVNLQLAYYLEDPDNNMEIIRKCRRILEDAIQEVRNLSHHMVMPRFSENGLQYELEILFGCFGPSVKVEMSFEKINEKKIPSAIKETIYRIAQVQIHNIEQHSNATLVGISVSVGKMGITVIINDNGIGFDTTQKRKGIGISNIFSRVESYNGTASIDSRPGQGCVLSVTIPLPATAPHTVDFGLLSIIPEGNP